MHHSQIPEKPLVAGISDKVEPAQKIYFFERSDGSVVEVQAVEAWRLWNNRNQILGHEKPRYKLIGVGDGNTYRQGVIESQRIFREQGLEAAQARIRQAKQEELEKARGHIETPPNMDKFGTGARFLTI